MIHNKTIDLFIELYIILIATRNIFLFCGLSGVASALFILVYIMQALTTVYAIALTVKRPIKANMYFFSSLIILLALVIIPLHYGAYIWTENSNLPISFLLTMLFVILTKKIVVSSRTIEICYTTSIIQALFALIISFWPSSFQNGILVLHMGNPNQTAIILWTIFSFCFLGWSKKKNSHRRSVGLWIIMVGLLIQIYLTESRNIIFSFLIVIILYYWVKILKRNKEIPVIIQVVLLASPIVIPVLVLSLMNILPTDITFFGKLFFSGRESIWNGIVTEFFSHPFAFHLNERPTSRYVLINGIASLKTMGAHNGILAILWYYGIIVALLVLFIFLSRIKDIKRCASNNLNACITYIIVLATIFSLSFEEGMIMGNVCTTMILPILFIIGQSEEYLESSSER